MKILLYIVILIGSMSFTANSYGQGVNRIAGATFYTHPRTTYASPSGMTPEQQIKAAKLVIEQQKAAIEQRIADDKRRSEAIAANKVAIAALPPIQPKTPEQLQAVTDKLFQFRKEQADANNSRCQYQVGVMYINGQGTVTNAALGMEYIQRASTNGSSDAVAYLKAQ